MIAALEKDYKVSIRLEARYRTLPAIRIARCQTEDRDNIEKIVVVPHYQWEGELSAHTVADEVLADHIKLIEDARKIGDVLCKGEFVIEKDED